MILVSVTVVALGVLFMPAPPRNSGPTSQGQTPRVPLPTAGPR